ncbi:hypothetical protein [Streptomyces adustus]|nr:hypothetical protein [Streptomyces adustus]
MGAKREHTAPPKILQPESELGRMLDLMAALHESVRVARADTAGRCA